ncbi:DUF4407 domain-containing protein [Flavilitoribacter nigricans]|uniref:DUF4407 domain-containing protein n=1 Tax=Flavilitoribacter nigricans (strain ATCC 23147 / DSM 23189 / NBRC 102662 / NCIMB 1420 / SS-2) TaxID=1122177 RepID=A0A2D0MYE3_FLAN2|nr:DUF4407 domain-containing protein [Flavilitoribacter nigricans]PHN01146.1 hypothetical protein CRP01_38735 [Flavilitoribacter nigricans DSM 23189 = NBRC 102662]
MTTPSSGKSSLPFLTHFFSLCAGSDVDVLSKCSKKEQNKHAGIGATVFMTGLVAWISGGYAFHRVFFEQAGSSESIFVGIALGLVWGLLIFNIDRFLVMSMQKTQGLWGQIAMALPRLLLAILISFVIAKPIEVRLFEDRIISEILLMKGAEYEERQAKLKERFGIPQLENDLLELDTTIEVLDSLYKSPPAVFQLKALIPEDSLCQVKLQGIKNTNGGKISELEQNNVKITREISQINSTIQNLELIVSDTLASAESIRNASTQSKRLINTRNELYSRRRINNGVIERLLGEIETQEEECSDIREKISAKEEPYYIDIRQRLETAKNQKDSLIKVIAKGKQDLEQEFLRDTAIIGDSYKPTLLTQIDALSSLTQWKKPIENDEGEIERPSNTLWWTGILISLIFIVIETAPILVKLMSDEGEYDLLVDKTIDETKIKQLLGLRKKMKGNIEDEITKTKDLAMKELQKFEVLKKEIKTQNPLADNEQLERILENVTYQSIQNIFESSRVSFNLKNPTPAQRRLDTKIQKMSSLIEKSSDETTRYKLIKYLMKLILKK